MKNSTKLTSLGIALAGLCLNVADTSNVHAEFAAPDFDRPNVTSFSMLQASVSQGREVIAHDAPSHLSSANIAAVSEGLLHIDADSGMLVHTSDELSEVASLYIGHDASQLVVDRGSKLAYVANRGSDRIDIVAYGAGLRKVRSIKTKSEPYGVALTPNAKTLLVTTVADRQLSAYETSTGLQQWSIEIGPEARGVAISPDGSEAMVTFLNTGATARVPLDAKTHAPRFVSLDRAAAKTGSSRPNRRSFAMAHNSIGNIRPSVRAPQSSNAGRRFSRAAFSATYIGNGMAVVPHQESTPELVSTGQENTGVYGGGGRRERPITHRLAFISTQKDSFERVAKAEVSLHQPRALTYDKKRDVLYVAGYGSDTLLALANASKPSIREEHMVVLSNASDPCGPTGLAVTDSGSVVAFCALGRQLAAVSFSDDGKREQHKSGKLTKSRFSEAAQRGRALFRQGNSPQLSNDGVMACESCHPEVRADGLSWRISGTALQTPVLAGKVLGTHPFKWDGGDKDLTTSLTHTVTRLGGSGINLKQAADIAAFLKEQSAPRTPTIASSTALARGKQLFQSEAVGCATCHSGPLRTNGQSYEFADDIAKVDTPALVGLAASAPYYHDGSAPTLRSLLLENGSVHGMGKVQHLSDQEVDDLIAYLKSL